MTPAQLLNTVRRKGNTVDTLTERRDRALDERAAAIDAALDHPDITVTQVADILDLSKVRVHAIRNAYRERQATP